jgi:hypothetical protein
MYHVTSFLASFDDNRKHPRFPVALPATVCRSEDSASALIHDIAVGGAMIETTLLLVPGAALSIRCGTIDVEASVTWRRAGRLGITFERQISQHQVKEQVDRSHALAARRLNQTALRSVQHVLR